MRTLENSKVDPAVKINYLRYTEEIYSPCQQTRMLSSKESDNADFTEEVEKLSSSPNMYEGLISNKEYKELFRISDKTIDLEAKNLLSDSGYFLPDSEEDETSLDSDNGTRSEETTDPDSEGQDEGDLEDAEEGALMVHNDDDDDLSASEDGKNDTGYSCEMTYIELDLSSQSHEDLIDDVELMMKNLKISVHSDYNLDSSSATPAEVCVDDCFDETNVSDPKLDDSSEKQVLNLHNDAKGKSAVNYVRTSGEEPAGSNPKWDTMPELFESFLPITASSLCSLSEKTYFRIADSLLDEETQLKLNAEDHLFNSDSCRTTLNTPDIPSEMDSSNQDLKSLITPDETAPADKMCPMTYVDLDMNEPCTEDMTLELLNNLNIKDDKTPLCRGNPSDQDALQTYPLCSEMADLEVPTVDLIDDPPFLIDDDETEMDSLENYIDVSSMSDLYSPETFPALISDFPMSSVLPPGASPNLFDDSFFDNISFDFFDSSSENDETQYENPFVTENLLKLTEINEFIEHEIPTTSPPPPPASLPPTSPPPLPSASPPPPPISCQPITYPRITSSSPPITYPRITSSSPPITCPRITSSSPITCPPLTALPPPLLSNNTVPNLFSRQTCLTNLAPLESPLPSTRRSLNSNVIPRLMTQTSSTQSDAIPAFPGFFVVLSTMTSMHGIKRPTCIEMCEPARKLFRFNNMNNFGLSEADSRKNAKQVVASLTDEQLLGFDNDESCLHEAVRTMNYENVLALLKRLEDFHSHNQDIINSKNDKSQTPLHLAVQANIPAIVHLLIKHGAEVNQLEMTPSKILETPLHHVASRGLQFRLVLKCLLEAEDLDINIKNSEGQTALHCAAVAHGTASSKCAQHIDSEYIIKKLLTMGADPLIQDNNGKNVLMYAIESKDLNLVSHITKTVCKDKIQELLIAATSNGQTCRSIAHSLKEQFTQIQWEKLINILTRHTSSK